MKCILLVGSPSLCICYCLIQVIEVQQKSELLNHQSFSIIFFRAYNILMLKYNIFQGIRHLDVKIKWPNDLYLDGSKVGGILCTSTYRSKKFHVSAGKHSHSFDVQLSFYSSASNNLNAIETYFLMTSYNGYVFSISRCIK